MAFARHQFAGAIEVTTPTTFVGSGWGAVDPIQRLTDRQREVLVLMAEGLANAAIAEKLCVRLKAVEKHINHIYRILEITDGDPQQQHPRVTAVLMHLRDIETRVQAGNFGFTIASAT